MAFPLKKTTISFILIVLCILLFTGTCFAATSVSITLSDMILSVDGRYGSEQVAVINGSSYLPINAVSELFNMDVEWKDAEKIITLKSRMNPAAKTLEDNGDYLSNITANHFSKDFCINQWKVKDGHNEYYKPFEDKEGNKYVEGIGFWGYKGTDFTSHAEYSISNKNYKIFEADLAIDKKWIGEKGYGTTQFVIYADGTKIFSKLSDDNTNTEHIIIPIPEGTKILRIEAIHKKGGSGTHGAIFGNARLLKAEALLNTAEKNSDPTNLDTTLLMTLSANGKSLSERVFVINGTRYLPSRAVSELLNMGVEWKGTEKILIFKSRANPTTKTLEKNGAYLSNITANKFSNDFCINQWKVNDGHNEYYKHFEDNEGSKYVDGIGFWGYNGTDFTSYAEYSIGKNNYKMFEADLAIDKKWIGEKGYGTSEFVIYADGTRIYSKVFKDNTRTEHIKIPVPEGTNVFRIEAIHKKGGSGTHGAVFGNARFTMGSDSSSPMKQVYTIKDKVIQLKIGEKADLITTLTNDSTNSGRIIWSSSNDHVSVTPLGDGSKAQIEGRIAGKAYITAAYNDKSERFFVECYGEQAFRSRPDYKPAPYGSRFLYYRDGLLTGDEGYPGDIHYEEKLLGEYTELSISDLFSRKMLLEGKVPATTAIKFLFSASDYAKRYVVRIYKLERYHLFSEVSRDIYTRRDNNYALSMDLLSKEPVNGEHANSIIYPVQFSTPDSEGAPLYVKENCIWIEIYDNSTLDTAKIMDKKLIYRGQWIPVAQVPYTIDKILLPRGFPWESSPLLE